MEQTRRGQAVAVTALGRRGLREAFGLDALERGDNAK
jgi:hypothetical protein